MTTDTSTATESEAVRRPPQFGIWQMLVIVACCAIVLTGWRKYLEVEGPFEALLLVVLVAGMATILLILFRRWMKSWAEATVALLIATVLFAAAAPKPLVHDHTYRRWQCGGNLKAIAIALHTYHEVYQSFPPAYIADEHGRPMHSWRVLLLPYLEQQPLYDQYRFDEPWDGPNNRRLHRYVVNAYQCPGTAKQPARPDDTQTSYVVVVGEHTAFPGTRAISLKEVKDGTDNVIAAVEVKDSGIHWMEPRDLNVTQMAMQINAPRGQGISSKHPPYPHVVMADGMVRILPPKTDPDLLRRLLGIDDGGEWPLAPGK